MGRKSLAASFNEQMRRIYKMYVEDGGVTPVDLHVLYEYAVNRGLWKYRPVDVRRQFCKQMSQALRDDYFVDRRGKTVRRNHAVFEIFRDEQGEKVRRGLWDNIDTASKDHLGVAFQLRRKQIVGDCRQLKNDVDYVNEERDFGTIPMLFDMTADMVESDLPTEYQPAVVGSD